MSKLSITLIAAYILNPDQSNSSCIYRFIYLFSSIDQSKCKRLRDRRQQIKVHYGLTKVKLLSKMYFIPVATIVLIRFLASIKLPQVSYIAIWLNQCMLQNALNSNLIRPHNILLCQCAPSLIKTQGYRASNNLPCSYMYVHVRLTFLSLSHHHYPGNVSSSNTHTHKHKILSTKYGYIM